jgi:hypothetical protein
MIWAIVELTVCLAPVLLSAHSMPEPFFPPQTPLPTRCLRWNRTRNTILLRGPEFATS